MQQSGEQTPEMAMRWKHGKKMMPCRECGEPMEVGIRTKKNPRHVECGVRASIEQQFQMGRKSGPYYDKWLQNPGGRNGRALGGTPVVKGSTSPELKS